MPPTDTDPAPTPPAAALPGSFAEQVRLALAHVHDPAWLAAHSPLAAPYFLGAGDGAQGERLRAALHEAARSLWGEEPPPERAAILAAVEAERAQQGKGGRYTFLLLDLHFFRHHFQVPKLSHIWEDYLFVGKSQYYRDLDAAVQQLAARLLARLRPTFRPEQPPAAPALVGRDATLAQSLAALRAGQSVALCGASGVGKTTVAAAVAARWPSPTVFWFTVRPSLNDQLQGFLFALGAWARGHGSAALWRQLVASGGRIEDANLALGLARWDLDTLRAAQPLLCLDEADALRPAEPSEATPAHVQLLDFVASLRDAAPLLLVGQRAVLETDALHELTGLAPDAVAELLQRAGVPAEADAVARLHRYTGGNARLLVLCVALCAAGEPLASVVERLPGAAALHALWARLWERLTPGERGLLQALAVFRAPAPADGWRGAQPALDALRARFLVQDDGRGGLSLVPAFRDLVYQRLPSEARERLHGHAAAIRAARGEWTAAAFHCWQAGEAEQAVGLWFAHADQEIARGQAHAARPLFQQLSLHRLSRDGQRRLALLRARLHRFAGDPDGALRDLRAVEWPADREESVAAALLEGQVVQGLGQPEAALQRYDEGLALAARLLARQVELRVARGVVQVRQRAVQQAWREATLAQYEAAHLQGVVQEAMGNFQVARSHFRVALALADEAGHPAGSARTLFHLAGLAGRQGETGEAATLLERAMAHHEQVGDSFGLECARCNLAGTRFQAGDFLAAADLARQALAFFERIRHPYWSAVAASNLAEACWELGDLAGAEAAAGRSLDQEEPYTQPYALFTLGNVRRAQGDAARAGVLFQESIRLADANRDSYIAAYAWRALGALQAAQDQPDEAQQALQQALALFERMGMDKEATTTQEQLAALGMV